MICPPPSLLRHLGYLGLGGGLLLPGPGVSVQVSPGVPLLAPSLHLRLLPALLLLVPPPGQLQLGPGPLVGLLLLQAISAR